MFSTRKQFSIISLIVASRLPSFPTPLATPDTQIFDSLMCFQDLPPFLVLWRAVYLIFFNLRLKLNWILIYTDSFIHDIYLVIVLSQGFFQSCDIIHQFLIVPDELFPVRNRVQPKGWGKWGFVMDSRTQGVQEILENIYVGCLHSHKSEVGDGMRWAGPLRVVLNSNSFADNL